MGYEYLGEGGHVVGGDFCDADMNPAGGYAWGTGFRIDWQDGPVDRDAGELPSGAFVEDVLLVLIARMRFFQGEVYDNGNLGRPAVKMNESPAAPASDGRFACEENAEALEHLEKAHAAMMRRRADRRERGVLGKHKA